MAAAARPREPGAPRRAGHPSAARPARRPPVLPGAAGGRAGGRARATCATGRAPLRLARRPPPVPARHAWLALAPPRAPHPAPAHPYPAGHARFRRAYTCPHAAMQGAAPGARGPPAAAQGGAQRVEARARHRARGAVGAQPAGARARARAQCFFARARSMASFLSTTTLSSPGGRRQGGGRARDAASPCVSRRPPPLHAPARAPRGAAPPCPPPHPHPAPTPVELVCVHAHAGDPHVGRLQPDVVRRVVNLGRVCLVCCGGSRLLVSGLGVVSCGALLSG
jgi:hypothetical protein